MRQQDGCRERQIHFPREKTGLTCFLIADRTIGHALFAQGHVGHQRQIGLAIHWQITTPQST